MRYLKEVEVPAGLEQAILQRVARLARRRLIAFNLLAAGSFAGLSYGVIVVGQSFWQSGFYQYLRLLWTDQSVLIAWRELGLSLLESLPVVSLVAVLALGGLGWWLILKALENNHYGSKKFVSI